MTTLKSRLIMHNKLLCSFSKNLIFSVIFLNFEKKWEQFWLLASGQLEPKSVNLIFLFLREKLFGRVLSAYGFLRVRF